MYPSHTSSNLHKTRGVGFVSKFCTFRLRFSWFWILGGKYKLLVLMGIFFLSFSQSILLIWLLYACHNLLFIGQMFIQLLCTWWYHPYLLKIWHGRIDNCYFKKSIFRLSRSHSKQRTKEIKRGEFQLNLSKELKGCNRQSLKFSKPFDGIGRSLQQRSSEFIPFEGDKRVENTLPPPIDTFRLDHFICMMTFRLSQSNTYRSQWEQILACAKPFDTKGFTFI